MNNNKKIIAVCLFLVCLLIALLVYLFASEGSTKNYTITFNSDGGTFVDSVTVKDGEMVARPNDPVKNGYMFVGWTLDGIIYNFNTPIHNDITLNAKWMKDKDEVEKVVITFDSDGGTTIPNQIIEKGKEIVKPIEPTKDGYKFKYWTLEEKEFDFNTLIEENTKLVAVWEKVDTDKPTTSNNDKPTTKKYTVKFNTDGGNSISSQTVNEGSKASKPSNPAKNGYTFVEWQLNGKTYSFDSKITGNITLKAIWRQNEVTNYTVTFNSNGGSSVASQTVAKGSKVSTPSNPTKNGYTFVEWQLNGTAYNFNNVVNSNITLVAIWRQDVQKTYKVVATPVDQYSPDMRLQVLEDNSSISVSKIEYIDGVTLCDGSNLTVSKTDLDGETQLIVVLLNGTRVTATIQ